MLCLDSHLRFIVHFALHRKHIPSQLQTPFTESIFVTISTVIDMYRQILAKNIRKRNITNILTMGVALFYKERRTDGQS